MPPSDRNTRAREIILARRALFIASALQGIGLGARTAHAMPGEREDAPPAPDAPSEPEVVPGPVPPSPFHNPQPCLTPPHENYVRPAANRLELVLAVAPAVLVPVSRNTSPVGAMVPITIGVRRDLVYEERAPSLDLQLFAIAGPSAAGSDAFGPLGGGLRLTVGDRSLLRQPGHPPDYLIIAAVELAGGAWLAPRAADDAAWRPSRGAWLSIACMPIGLRLRAFEVGVPVTVHFTTQRSSTDERLAASYVTVGLALSLGVEVKKRSKGEIN